jgi:hypothetical protein
MDADRIVRVRYFNRQFLRPQDFTDEQAYHVALRRRHNIAGHSWGIVDGLSLSTDGGPLVVEPGFAWDGYGREIALIERLTVPPLPPALVAGETAYDIWLCYGRIGSDQAPVGYAACGADATAYYRWQELPQLQVTEADDTVDADHPPGVPDGDLAFGAERTAPEQDRPWPVLLGRIHRAAGDGHITLDGSGRRYAGLVAESVEHPDGSARLDLGAAAPGDPVRFAVRAPAAGDALFDVTGDGTVTAHGTLTVQGELRIDAGAVSFPPAEAGQPAAARPWQLYGVRVGNQRELRVELPQGADNSLVVGTWSDQNTFTPCLTVSSDNTVTVHGTLNVLGKLDPRGGLTAQPEGDQARALTTGTLLSGVGGAAGVAARLYRPQPATTPYALAAVLAANPDLMREVATRLRQGFSEAAFALAEQLTTQE